MVCVALVDWSFGQVAFRLNRRIRGNMVCYNRSAWMQLLPFWNDQCMRYMLRLTRVIWNNSYELWNRAWPIPFLNLPLVAMAERFQAKMCLPIFRFWDRAIWHRQVLTKKIFGLWMFNYSHYFYSENGFVYLIWNPPWVAATKKANSKAKRAITIALANRGGCGLFRHR